MPHPYPIWLKGKREKRRRLKDIKRFVEPNTIYNIIIEGESWPYTSEQAEYYKKRDRALLSLLYLTAGRINEILSLNKSQFDFSDSEFIVIKDFVISKRKKKTIQRMGKPKIDLPLPKVGQFAKFTQLVMEYYEISPKQLFKIGRKRAWAIVKHMTGKWCHYFRSQKLSYLVNESRSALITSKIVGIKNPGTLSHYYKTEWQEHRELLKK